jgi:hypothetical protein
MRPREASPFGGVEPISASENASLPRHDPCVGEERSLNRIHFVHSVGRSESRSPTRMHRERRAPATWLPNDGDVCLVACPMTPGSGLGAESCVGQISLKK